MIGEEGRPAVETRVVKRSPPTVVRQVEEVAPLLLDEVLEDVEVAPYSSIVHRRIPVLLSCKEARREKRKRKEEKEDTPEGER